MSLSIGVVTIKCLETPQQPVEGFLLDLHDEARWGLEDAFDGEEAQVTNDGLIEVNQRYLRRRADDWVTERNIDNAGQSALSNWIAGLPWQEGAIILQLGR